MNTSSLVRTRGPLIVPSVLPADFDHLAGRSAAVTTLRKAATEAAK